MEQEEESPKSGNSGKEEVPENSNKFESKTAHQRYLRKRKASVIDSSSPQQYQGVHVDPRRRLEFDVESLLRQVSYLKYQALNLMIQAGGGRFQAPDLTSQIGGAGSESNKAPIQYEQQQQALIPRTTVAEEDELKLMRAVERLEIINKTEPVRPVRRNIELPDKVVLLRSQVTDLESLVEDLRSHRRFDNPDDEIQGGNLRHRYSQRPGTGRSSPTLERIHETKPSSSLDSHKRRGK